VQRNRIPAEKTPVTRHRTIQLPRAAELNCISTVHGVEADELSNMTRGRTEWRASTRESAGVQKKQDCDMNCRDAVVYPCASTIWMLKLI
jgi:hypothetical protein